MPSVIGSTTKREKSLEQIERELLAEHKRVNAEVDALDAKLFALFDPRIKACIEAGDRAGAEALFRRMPECVARVRVYMAYFENRNS